MYSSSQLAVLVALKKGLNSELLGIIAALHDIGAIKTKRRENHGKNASKFVYEVIELYNSVWRRDLPLINDSEISIIHEAMKDVDSLDRYLHGIDTKGNHITHLNNLLDLFELKRM